MRNFFRKLKKGVTLAETVIAMAIITTVSITTISIVEKGSIQSNKSKAYSELRAVANNAYESFKYSDCFSAYVEAMNLTRTQYVSYYKEKTAERYYVRYKNGYYEEVVTLEYTATIDRFTVVCNDGDKEIFTFSLTKPHDTEVTYDD